MLADVAELERRCGRGLSLNCQVPLLVDRGLNLLVPNEHNSSRERVSRNSATWTRLRLYSRCGLLSRHFGRSEGGISGQTEVSPGSLHVGGDGVGTAKDRLSSPIRRRPGKADAGLDCRQTILRVVECTAIAIYARILYGSGNQVQ